MRISSPPLGHIFVDVPQMVVVLAVFLARPQPALHYLFAMHAERAAPTCPALSPASRGGSSGDRDTRVVRREGGRARMSRFSPGSPRASGGEGPHVGLSARIPPFSLSPLACVHVGGGTSRSAGARTSRRCGPRRVVSATLSPGDERASLRYKSNITAWRESRDRPTVRGRHREDAGTRPQKEDLLPSQIRSSHW